MKNSTKLAIAVLAVIVIWHIIVAMSDKSHIAGLFMAKPAPGYSWMDADNEDARFFWQTMDVKWQPRLPHPDFKAEASEKEGVWDAQPGYKFLDKTKDLNTVWAAGLIHPDFMAWSDDVEGEWIPVTGYKFIYEGDTFVDTIWDPGKRYDDLKVISLAEKDRYKPFPGYTFTQPGKSLLVVWTPGTVNSDNPRLVAGTSEGSWKVNASPSRRSSNSTIPWIVGRALWYAL